MIKKQIKYIFMLVYFSLAYPMERDAIATKKLKTIIDCTVKCLMQYKKDVSNVITIFAMIPNLAYLLKNEIDPNFKKAQPYFDKICKCLNSCNQSSKLQFETQCKFAMAQAEKSNEKDQRNELLDCLGSFVVKNLPKGSNDELLEVITTLKSLREDENASLQYTESFMRNVLSDKAWNYLRQSFPLNFESEYAQNAKHYANKTLREQFEIYFNKCVRRHEGTELEYFLKSALIDTFSLFITKNFSKTTVLELMKINDFITDSIINDKSIVVNKKMAAKIGRARMYREYMINVLNPKEATKKREYFTKCEKFYLELLRSENKNPANQLLKIASLKNTLARELAFLYTQVNNKSQATFWYNKSILYDKEIPIEDRPFYFLEKINGLYEYGIYLCELAKEENNNRKKIELLKEASAKLEALLKETNSKLYNTEIFGPEEFAKLIKFEEASVYILLDIYSTIFKKIKQNQLETYILKLADEIRVKNVEIFADYFYENKNENLALKLTELILHKNNANYAYGLYLLELAKLQPTTIKKMEFLRHAGVTFEDLLENTNSKFYDMQLFSKEDSEKLTKIEEAATYRLLDVYSEIHKKDEQNQLENWILRLAPKVRIKSIEILSDYFYKNKNQNLFLKLIKIILEKNNANGKDDKRIKAEAYLYYINYLLQEQKEELALENLSKLFEFNGSTVKEPTDVLFLLALVNSRIAHKKYFDQVKDYKKHLTAALCNINNIFIETNPEIQESEINSGSQIINNTALKKNNLARKKAIHFLIKATKSPIPEFALYCQNMLTYKTIQ